MEYKILHAEFAHKLEEKVNNYLRDGWKCQGGLFCDKRYVYQAMIKEDKE